MKRILFRIVALAALYALVLVSVDLWDLLTGVILAVVLLLVFRPFLAAGSPGGPATIGARLLAFWPFAGAIFLDMMKGAWLVALVVLGLRPQARPGLVEIPIEERTPIGVAVTALVMGISPGSYLIDVDWERGVMLFHLIHAGDPDATRQETRDFYQRYQRRVFP